MTAIPVVISGSMVFSDLSVGGGPMPGGGTPQPPLGIWGPPGPWPTPPIHLPPSPPLGIWGGAPIPWPTPPIYVPTPTPPGSPTHPWVPPSGGVPPGYPSFPIWGPPGSGFPGTPGYPPVATPPIFIPEPPEGPPSEGNGRWVYAPGVGWIWVAGPPSDKPTPVP